MTKTETTRVEDRRPMPIEGKFYTTEEMKQLLGGVTRARVVQIAQAYNIPSHTRTAFYEAHAVEKYLRARTRYQLAEKLGRPRGRSATLIYSEEYDVPCPECDGLAISLDGETWFCENGHTNAPTEEEQEDHE